MACANHPFVHQDGICSACHDFADCSPHIRQAFDGPDRNAVVHRDYDGLVGIAVDYSFQPYLFAYHCQSPNMEIEIQKLALLIRHTSGGLIGI
jgi:hypothetical protein